MTNPPVPATPLDVEACVRLLKRFVWASAMTPVGWSTPGVYLTKEEQALIDALASALPGMGKDSERIDWFEVNAFNAGFHDGACEVLDADGNEWRANTFREAVDRAAQPEETSADA